MSSQFKIIGTRQPRLDAWARVSGRAKYASDISFPGMLHLKVVRSPHPHANVLNIDAQKAAALPGVRLILTTRTCLPTGGILTCRYSLMWQGSWGTISYVLPRRVRR